MIDRLIVYSTKYQKSTKDADLKFPESDMMSSNRFFCPNNSPKHTDSSFIITNDTEKKQILTIKTLNQKFF